MHSCDQCGTTFTRKESLRRHKADRCKSATNRVPVFVVGEKRAMVLPEPARRKNPKIEALLDAVVNNGAVRKPMRKKLDGADIEGFLFDRPLSLELDNVKGIDVDGRPILPGKDLDLKDIGAVVIDNGSGEDIAGVVGVGQDNFAFKKKKLALQRTKGDIIDYNSDSSSSSSNSDSSDTDSAEEEDQKSCTVKFLPPTVGGLAKRLRKLWTQFTREAKHEHRNEIVFILDELLRRDGISGHDFSKMNNLLAQSLPDDSDVSGEEEEDASLPDGSDDDVSGEDCGMEAAPSSDGQDVKALARSIVSDVIKDDTVKVNRLIKDFKKEVAGSEYINTVDEFDELVQCFFEDDLLEGEPVMQNIKKLLLNLNDSPIAKSKLQEIKILLNGIKANRHRVFSILVRIHNADKDSIPDVLRQLAQEDLISEEQFFKLKKLAEKDFSLHAVADIVNVTKIGRGVLFLPRTLTALTKKLSGLVEDKSCFMRVKKELVSVLDELLARGSISYDQYNTVKEENNI